MDSLFKKSGKIWVEGKHRVPHEKIAQSKHLITPPIISAVKNIFL